MTAVKPESIPALGREFALGQLYDIRRHQIITDKTWSPEQISQMTARQNQSPNVSFSLEYESDTRRRAEKLGLNAQLQFCIQFKVFGFSLYEKSMTGSARYVTEASSTETKGSVTLQYDVKGDFEELQCFNEQLDEKFIETGATHVVTGIRYGGKALIVCKGWSNESSFFESATSYCHELIDWKMEQWIRDAGSSARNFAKFGLPSGSLNTGSYQIECYTDFRQPARTLQRPPDVLDYFRTLDSRDGKKPMEIYLTPLHYFCTSVPASIEMANAQHIEEACQYLQALKSGFEQSEKLLESIIREEELSLSIGETVNGYKRDLDGHIDQYMDQMRASFLCHHNSDDFLEEHHAGSLDSNFTFESMDTSFGMFGRQTRDLCALSSRLRQGINQTSVEELETRAEDLAKEIEELFNVHDSNKQLQAQVSSGLNRIRVRRTRIEERARENQSCITWCIKCRKTCHENCGVKNNEEKAQCCAMNSDGFCNECSCHWRLHRNTSTEQREVEYYEWIHLPDMSKKYKENFSQRGAQRRLQYHLGVEASMALQKTAYSLVSAHRCLKGLDQGIDLDQFIQEKLRSKNLDYSESSKLFHLAKAIDRRVEDRNDYSRFARQPQPSRSHSATSPFSALSLSRSLMEASGSSSSASSVVRERFSRIDRDPSCIIS